MSHYVTQQVVSTSPLFHDYQRILKHVVVDPRAVAVSRYGWLKTSYGWLAG